MSSQEYLMLRLEGRNGSEKEWSQYYKIEGMPTVAFIDSDGKVTQVPLELRDDPEQYLANAVVKTDEDRKQNRNQKKESDEEKKESEGIRRRKNR